MKTADFDYNLPEELIAQTPIEQRDHARLLILDRQQQTLTHRHFYDLPDYLRPGDLLVLNDTRVLHARLLGRKETGGNIEIFLLRPQPDGAWQALVRGRNLSVGKRILLDEPDGGYITATITAAEDGPIRTIAFDAPVENWLDDLGEVPLPPYIHAALPDPERYQTVYGRREGAVAASTAGLHFTPELLLTLRDQGVQITYVTLHIGLGTFQPVKVTDPNQHAIHSEWMELTPAAARQINDTRLRGNRIVAVGTTAVRVLESAAKIALGLAPCDPAPSDLACGWQTVAAWTGDTNLFILPGHTFRAVDAMITNFHLPRSTLLMLVSAFAGPADAGPAPSGRDFIAQAYAEAVARRYRFFSFGDAMLIL